MDYVILYFKCYEIKKVSLREITYLSAHKQESKELQKCKNMEKIKVYFMLYTYLSCSDGVARKCALLFQKALETIESILLQP